MLFRTPINMPLKRLGLRIRGIFFGRRLPNPLSRLEIDRQHVRRRPHEDHVADGQGVESGKQGDAVFAILVLLLDQGFFQDWDCRSPQPASGGSATARRPRSRRFARHRRETWPSGRFPPPRPCVAGRSIWPATRGHRFPARTKAPRARQLQAGFRAPGTPGRCVSGRPGPAGNPRACRPGNSKRPG